MVAIQKHSLCFILTAITLCLLHILVTPTLAANIESMKTELRDGTGGGNAVSSGGNGASTVFSNRRNLRSVYGLGPKMLQISRSKIPIELDLLVENDDVDRSKRFDDYGHMRFGKRGGDEQFDDYGHMRFGRST